MNNQLKENYIVKSLSNLKNNINNIHREGCPNFEMREYMSGLYNGYEIALSLIENRQPTLKTVKDVEFNDIFHTGFNIDTDSINDESIANNEICKDEEIPDNDTYGYNGFIKDVEKAINSNCVENYSNTPDFILAEFLTDILKTVEKLMNNRDKWYNFNPLRHNINKAETVNLNLKVKDLPIFDGIIEIIKEFSLNDSIPDDTKQEFKNKFDKLFESELKDECKNNE